MFQVWVKWTCFKGVQARGQGSSVDVLQLQCRELPSLWIRRPLIIRSNRALFSGFQSWNEETTVENTNGTLSRIEEKDQWK